MPELTGRVQLDSHPAQEAFLEDHNSETAYIGGVGSGKTAGGVLRSAKHISEWNEGHTGVIVSPTVPMLRNVIVPELRQWGLLDRPGIEYRSSENRIEYPNGSTIILESANNDRKIERLRGLNLAWAWMDEAAYLPEKVYRILNDRLRVGNYRNLFATTTPRGFNWLYDAFGDVDGASESIADGRLIRNDTTTAIMGVSTRANPANPEDYIEREERQHSGQSYEQEVQGEFVQFEGLVYDWFDRETHLTHSVPERYDEVIYGVDWGFDNPAVTLTLVRNGEQWFVADEMCERRLTDDDHAERTLSMQENWGSGTVYCDPSEPSSIETFKRKGLSARAADNDVMPGIKHVTSKRESIRIHADCQAVRNEISQYQYKDNATGETVLKENDHCFAAGTPVLTDSGEVPIESISTDDQVLTRAGYRPVVWAGMTSEDADLLRVEFSNGSELVGTPSHPVYTTDKGYIDMDALRYGDVCLTAPQTESNTMALHSTEMNVATMGPVDTTGRTAHLGSTARFGEMNTVQSRVGTSSTTLTETPQTTTWTTSSASPSRNMHHGTLSGAGISLRGPSKQQKNGTGLMKGGTGTQSIGKRPFNKYSRTRRQRTATNAGPSSSIIQAPGSAQTPANHNIDETQGSMTKNESAKPAENPTQSTNTATERRARVVAVERLSRGQSVYNLGVAGVHEYFADGILVHNCMDALRYALFTHQHTGDAFLISR